MSQITLLSPHKIRAKSVRSLKWVDWFIAGKNGYVMLLAVYDFLPKQSRYAGRFQRARKARLSLPLPPILICVICDGCQNFVPPNFCAQQLCLNWFYVVIRLYLKSRAKWATFILSNTCFRGGILFTLIRFSNPLPKIAHNLFFERPLHQNPNNARYELRGQEYGSLALLSRI